MARSQETWGLLFVLLALIAIALYLLGKQKSSTSVSITTAQGGVVMQRCVADDGSVFFWPVQNGPCPKISTSF